MSCNHKEKFVIIRNDGSGKSACHVHYNISLLLQKMFEFDPIGRFRGDAVLRYEAPRQGVFAGGHGCVELEPGRGFDAALRNIEGFERIWLLFVFDRNIGTWRPTARPPVAAPGFKRVGLFASRAPYRPNPIGMSCVKLKGVDGLTLHVAEADLLDGTPILDIKPYIPAADAFPNACAGWVDGQCADEWDVDATTDFLAAAARVRSAGAPDLLRDAKLQLSRNPFDLSRKRVTRTSRGGILALRMFRLEFSLDEVTHRITLLRLASGYSPAELNAPDDPYADKAFHRALLAGAPFSS